jgi:hypothetical protein
MLGAFLNACGGGGEEAASSPPVTQPSSYQYQIRSLPAGPMIAANALETLQVTGLNMDGTFNRETDEVTLVNGGNPGPLATLESTSFGTLPLDVTQEMRWVGGMHPTRGEYVVRISATEIVRVTVDNVLQGVHVDQIINGQNTGSGSFNWIDFESLLGSQAPAYQQIAHYAYGARGLVLEQAGRVIDALDIITSREAELAVGPVTVDCDPYPPAGGARGSIRYAWIDTNASGSLGPGDAFTITFDQCWENDPSDDIDNLLSGAATLSGYTEASGPPLLIGGDMTFSNFVMTETEEGPPGVFTILPDPVTINGGFRILFVGQ